MSDDPMEPSDEDRALLADLGRDVQDLILRPTPPEPGVFEFALVLGGTASAGSYTAGALDFLIEALDCFTQHSDAPRHKVVLKLIAGTSGGGVTAAIAARALGYRVPPVSPGTAPTVRRSGNPLYDIWVERLRLERFLDTADLSGGVRSLLSGEPIAQGVDDVTGFGTNAGDPPPQIPPRAWLGAPLRLILTFTNLRGLPDTLAFGHGLSQTYLDHADHARFAVVYPGQAIGPILPDEFVLNFDDTRLPNIASWQTLGDFAQATSAFPLGFPAVVLTRPRAHYAHRLVPLPPGTGGKVHLRRQISAWPGTANPDPLAPDIAYHCLAVDGGAANNEPIELGRTGLAGLLGRNDRDAATANRAVILIDPFAGAADAGPESWTDLLTTAGAIEDTLVQQARYDTRDLLLAADPTVSSRFMLTPRRTAADGTVLTGARAIASGGLRAFIGFACPDFMRHDYLLGRRDCQRFLREEFVLDPDNPLFDPPRWTGAQKRDTWFLYTDPDGKPWLPIIPLVGSAAIPEPTPTWPRGAFNPETVRDAVRARVRGLAETAGSGNLLWSFLGWTAGRAFQFRAADSVIESMKDYFRMAGL